MNKPYLYFTVFVSGMTALAIELSASRLLGSVFGTSNLVWAAIIGLILVYLSAGYLVGGYWADRSPKAETLYSILAWAALTTSLVPFLSQPVLRSAADAFDALNLGVLFGSFSAVLVLFSVPVTLLGTVSPFAIRLSVSDLLSTGRTAGQLYAVSTLGSFIGAFLPPLVMIPLLGTAMTFLGFSLFLALVALVGLGLAGSRRRLMTLVWIPAAILVLMVITANRPIKNSTGQIFETESAYNYIQVLEKDGVRMLRLNEGQGIHSVWHPERLDFAGPWEQFLAAPFFNPAPYDIERVERVAIIGLAGGTVSRQLTEVYGSMSPSRQPPVIDGYEIDPQIINAGKVYFDMNQENLNPIAQDGRWGLAVSDQTYDLVILDAYRPPYIPWHLTTQEFFEEVRDHLAPDGTLALNVGSDSADRSLIEGMLATIKSVFPSVYMMEVPNTFNYIIYASAQPTSMDNIYENYLSLVDDQDPLAGNQGPHPLLLASLRRLIENQLPLDDYNIDPDLVFSDDHAPVEWIVNRMVLSFLFLDEMEQMK